MTQDSHDDFIQRAQNGDQRAFVELLVEYDYEEVIHRAIRAHIPKINKHHHDVFFQKIIRDVYQAFAEFSADKDVFKDWLYRTTEELIEAERIKIARAKKRNQEAFIDLITDYEDVIHKVVQEYAPKIQEYDDRQIFAVSVEDAYWAVYQLRIEQESFGGWLHDTATENCFFLHLQERFRHGDQDNAFTTFRDYYEPIIKQFIYGKFPRIQKQDEEEIVQDVEMQAYRTIPEFDRKGSSFRYWLRKTTRGFCLNMITKHKKYQEREIPLDNVHVSTLSDPSAPPDFRDTFNFVQELIKLLSPEYKEVVILHDILGLKDKEIAKNFHISAVRVRGRLCEARKLLRKIRKIVEDCGIPVKTITSRLREKNIRLTKIVKELYKDCFET